MSEKEPSPQQENKMPSSDTTITTPDTEGEEGQPRRNNETLELLETEDPAAWGIDPYEEYAKCPKCYSMIVHTLWCDGSMFGHCVRVLYFNEELLNNHLHRTCERCNYDWIEAPGDFIGGEDVESSR